MVIVIGFRLVVLQVLLYFF